MAMVRPTPEPHPGGSGSACRPRGASRRISFYNANIRGSHSEIDGMYVTSIKTRNMTA
jgi:hypothetical protein